MAWPSSDVDTTGMDSGADTPPRATFLSWAQKFNELINHFSTYMRGLVTATDAAAARTTLDVPSRTGGNASGNWPINSVNVTGVVAIANGGTGNNDAANAFAGLKQAATESSSGVLEIATAAETQAFTDNTRAITPLRLASAFQDGQQALGSTGYQRLPGGVIIQWGSISVTTGGQVIFYPLAFPNSSWSVVATAGGNNGGNNSTSYIDSIGTSGFTLTNASGTTNTWKWIAIGR